MPIGSDLTHTHTYRPHTAHNIHLHTHTHSTPLRCKHPSVFCVSWCQRSA